MDNLNTFIQQEKLKKQMETPAQNNTNVKMSLLDLKRAVDTGIAVVGNPLVETIKKIDNKIDPVNIINPIHENRNKISNNGDIYTEKEDEFTRQLLLKTKEFMTGKQAPVITETYTTPVQSQPIYSSNGLKEDAVSVLKDTILELYVKERVEGIIKEYLSSDDGKQMIKSIVINLFKKK